MPNIKHITTKNINGLDVCLYDFDLSEDRNLIKLEEYLIQKINRMRIHKKAESYADCIPPNILEKYKDKFNENLQTINPVINRSPSRPHFSPKRSRITEFIGQLLLEKKESCIFYEEVDKKILMSSLDDDAHAPGIDITGIRKTSTDFKFLACELKANKEEDIPCSSAKSVLQDIKKAYDDQESRLTKELNDFLTSLNTIFEKDEDIKSIMAFLFQLLAEKDAKDILISNIVFIPFLIRQNNDILTNNNLDDFKEFKSSDFEKADIKGIILSFDKDITKFSTEIYNRAVSNE